MGYKQSDVKPNIEPVDSSLVCEWFSWTHSSLHLLAQSRCASHGLCSDQCLSCRGCWLGLQDQECEGRTEWQEQGTGEGSSIFPSKCWSWKGNCAIMKSVNSFPEQVKTIATVDYAASLMVDAYSIVLWLFTMLLSSSVVLWKEKCVWCHIKKSH